MNRNYLNNKKVDFLREKINYSLSKINKREKKQIKSEMVKEMSKLIPPKYKG